jgi:flagellar biosynthetic protein FliO
MKYLYSIAIIVTSAGRGFAQTAFADSIQAPNPISYAPSLLGILLKLIFSMVIIVGLIYLSMFLLKKMNSRTVGGSLNDTIRVMGRTYLAPKQCLYVVKIGEKYSVVGATESNINPITELNAEEGARLEKQFGKGESIPGMAKFADIFKGKLRQ